jgi:membrane-bound ClpP family serine protease
MNHHDLHEIEDVAVGVAIGNALSQPRAPSGGALLLLGLLTLPLWGGTLLTVCVVILYFGLLALPYVPVLVLAGLALFALGRIMAALEDLRPSFAAELRRGFAAGWKR